MDPVLSVVAAAVLAGVFASAAIHKIADFERFIAILSAYEIVPRTLVRPAGLGVALLELGGALLLLHIQLRGHGALIIAILLVLYMTAVAVNLARGRRDIDCGCTWGAGAQPLSPWLLARNAILLGLAGLASLDVLARPLGAADWITAASASIGLIMLYFCGEHLLANWSKLQRLRTEHE